MYGRVFSSCLREVVYRYILVAQWRLSAFRCVKNDRITLRDKVAKEKKQRQNSSLVRSTTTYASGLTRLLVFADESIFEA